MAKMLVDLDPVSDNHPYDPALFADKYGMTLKAAKVVLYANGPSRTACDGAAKAFMAAVAARNKQWQRDKP
ncbi:hypothetical protein LHFGNBLO_005830 [Mesorhizobium sp. AR10]|uniref:hypothetical protein n=1 Tax=Mesorhizobium sp. AR10 TaxID=2865839 RepID=UPI00215F4B6E|nr:hypothetical protein [Mesorhizobium sp. AR10]UVK38638.1 hypothetical protein LHFGNBLO_005830 [Mesorhizobium sp. AR10]